MCNLNYVVCVCVCVYVCVSGAKQPSALRFDGFLLWLHYTDGFGSVPGSLSVRVCVRVYACVCVCATPQHH